jgi:hypothetical protein
VNLAAPMAVGSAPNCSTAAALDASCVTGQINGNGVDLSGHNSQPGSGGGGGGGTHSPGGRPHKPKPPAPVCQGLPAACQKFVVTPPAAPGGSGSPAVTINDLRNFPASPGTDHMEPDGWMIVGLSTNFYSVVGIETVEGTLLGQPATVRFTPISWHWTYGDGTAATRSTPGATWAAQGIPEFDPTATSHVYSTAGRYFIDLSITFTADYRFAGGNWTRVVGTITLPANRLEATAGDAKTVLVNHDCSQNPGGPGC